MQVAKHKVVSFDYTLSDDQGTVIDTSEGHEPIVYLHGEGTIIPGLESALEGKSVGDSFHVTIEPSDGYGERSDGLEIEVSREHFADVDELELGMQFQVPTDDEGYRLVTVVEINDDTVTIDGNHALAGVTLKFDVDIRDVRDATQEEIDHGHAHGPDCHH